MANTSVLFLALFLMVELASAKVPEYVEVCKRDQSTINECVRNSIKGLRPYLPQGIPELNLPRMDPFTFDELKPTKGGLGELKTSFKNLQVSGLSNFDIKKLNVDLESKVIKALIHFPAVRINGKYLIDLQLLSLPIKGKGPFHANITGVDASAELKYKVESRGGAEHMKFKSCTVALKLKDYQIAMDGLFGDALGDAGQRIVQENRHELLRVILPYLESTISDVVVLDAANRVAASATYDELLPSS